jgi:sulfate permease, SulP family
MTAIPMAMGFAIAMGMRPEQGIIAGAVACLIGGAFGGSKYQIYGPTASFIPLIGALMVKYGEPSGATFQEGHGMLVAVSLIAGVLLMLIGLAGWGRAAKFVPNSIIVGFTIGYAVIIALANSGEALGLQLPSGGGVMAKLSGIFSQTSEINWWALGIALFTFFVTRWVLQISIFIPGPLIAMGLATAAVATVLSEVGVQVVKDRFGPIPTNFFQFTPPDLPVITSTVLFDICYFAIGLVFISGVESLLCSSMADRLADNKRTPYDPDKEFWGQGLVQMLTPLVNGLPCTGALARTATSIKAGAVTPFAGYFKSALKLALAFFLARYLDLVPMACIAGILLWVASNMIKVKEIKYVWNQNWFHAGLMIYTAIMVPLTDFLTGVLSALVIYAVLRPFVEAKPEADEPEDVEEETFAEPEFAYAGNVNREEAA